MDRRRADLIADIDSWSVAAEMLREVLAANTEAVAEGRASLESEAELVDSIAAISTAGRFLRMNAALEGFDMARFRRRSSLITLALAEGLSEDQLVANLGVPAELAGQVLAELRSAADPPAP